MNYAKYDVSDVVPVLESHLVVSLNSKAKP